MLAIAEALIAIAERLPQPRTAQWFVYAGEGHCPISGEFDLSEVAAITDVAGTLAVYMREAHVAHNLKGEDRERFMRAWAAYRGQETSDE